MELNETVKIVKELFKRENLTHDQMKDVLIYLYYYLEGADDYDYLTTPEYFKKACEGAVQQSIQKELMNEQ